MPSRMSRYYGSRTSNSRSERNAELYKSLYQTATDYSNVSMVATLEHPNEIEIDKIKQLIKDRETYQKQKEVSSLYKKQELKEKTVPVVEEVDKSYDIRDVLNKAKEERKNEDNSYKKNQYDYLLNSKAYTKKEPPKEDIKEELKDIINTITNNAELNSLSTKDLSLDLLGDLKSNTIIGKESTAIKKIIEDEKLKEKDEDKVEVDKSFYTKSLGFSDKDFEDDSFVDVKKAKGSTFIKVLLGVLLLIITVITIYVVYINVKSI